jgi:hypothetical protein
MNKTIDINEATVKEFVEKMRPEDAEIRKQLDYGYSYDGKTFILFEIRPVWMDPTEIQHSKFTKIRYYKSREEWNLYWMRASGKWDLYNPFPIATHLEQMLQIIDKDEYGCFFG